MDETKMLRKLGFSEYEARAYLSLARLGPSTVREIVLDSKLPRNKAYEALQKLEDRDRIASLPVSPKKYKILNPELFREDAEEMRKSVESLIRLVEQPKVTEFRDLFWVMKGRKAIIDKFAEDNAKAEKEILSCSELNRMLYRNMRIIGDATKRGVKTRFLTIFDKRNVDVYRAWMKAGVEIRALDTKRFGSLLPRISVMDSCRARLTIGKPEVQNEEDYISFWTESRAFALMLRNHFMNMWKQSVPLEKLMDSDRKLLKPSLI
jgi:sugar-specific transcriptional regulator TrmB